MTSCGCDARPVRRGDGQHHRDAAARGLLGHERAAHRLGQTRQVFVYKLVIEGSIEERLLELQARKSALAEGMLGRDDAAAVKFGEAELQALLAPLGAGIAEKILVPAG